MTSSTGLMTALSLGALAVATPSGTPRATATTVATTIRANVVIASSHRPNVPIIISAAAATTAGPTLRPAACQASAATATTNTHHGNQMRALSMANRARSTAADTPSNSGAATTTSTSTKSLVHSRNGMRQPVGNIAQSAVGVPMAVCT